MAEVFLSLGSNLGDRQAHLCFGLEQLTTAGVELLNCSDCYETAPYGGVEQADFLNLCMRGRTDLNVDELLTAIHEIEAAAGRQRLIRWGPRTLDIDILTYGRELIRRPDLVVPHRELAKRAFVLVPWAEIAPTFTVPGLGLTVWQLLGRLPQSELAGVKRIVKV